MRIGRGIATVVALAAAGVAAVMPVAVRSQTFDLETSRMAITEVDSGWRFQVGDDARWAQPGFDDAQWPILKPTEDWAGQGYAKNAELAWFRFRLRAPAHTDALVLELPEISKSYQLFCDGRLIAQVGTLPPGPAQSVIGAARVFTLPVHAGEGAKEITLALRLWQDPPLAGTRNHALNGQAYAGAPDVVLDHFAATKAAALMAQGEVYTRDIVVLIVGAAAVLLFLLTRERFYLWFAIKLLADSLFLVTDLAAVHFAWSYNFYTYFDVFIDLVTTVTETLFIVEALLPGKWRRAAVPVALAVVAEVAAMLVLRHSISLKWGDLGYFVAQSGVRVLLAWYLIRGWRAGNLYAKLLFFPFAIDAVMTVCANLSYALRDLKIPTPAYLNLNSVILLEQPFAVSVDDVGTVVSMLGMLAVLVYRFARTNREEQRLSAALKAAHDIQQRLVPVNVPALGGLRTEVAYRAAEEVGGDFCQILLRPDGAILVAIGDVSGKGLQAAMVGAVAVGALRSIADECLGPSEALERLNGALLHTEDAGFVTCLFLVLAADGELMLANAGHLSPYLNGTEMAVESGLPLGIVAGVQYGQSSFELPATSRLTLLSDGVVEARSRSGELFGFERMLEVSSLAASEIAAQAHAFGQEDDITVITLDWRGTVVAAA